MSYNGETIKIPSSHIKKYESDKVNNNVIDKVSATLKEATINITKIKGFKAKAIEVYNGMFVAVGDNGIYYSNDGITFNEANLNSIGISELNDITINTSGNNTGRWVVCGKASGTGNALIIYSDDGINFSLSTIAIYDEFDETKPDYVVDDRVQFEDVFYKCIKNTIWARAITNTEYWQVFTTGFALSSITSKTGIFVAVSGAYKFYSTDGTAFTRSTISATYDWKLIASTSGKFSALGVSTSGVWALAYSITGDTFTVASDTNLNGIETTTDINWRALITNDDDEFIAVGYEKLTGEANANGTVIVSTDGESYGTKVIVPYVIYTYGLSYFNGRYVILGYPSHEETRGTVYTDDLTTFYPLNYYMDSTCITNYKGYYITAGSSSGFDDTIYRSTNGSRFTRFNITNPIYIPQTNGTGTNNYKLKTSELFRSDIKIDNKQLFNSIAENLILHRTNGLATAKIDVVILPYYDTSTSPVVVIDQDTATNIFKSGMLVKPYITENKPLGRYSNNTAMVFRVTNATVDFSGIGKQTLSLIEKPQ